MAGNNYCKGNFRFSEQYFKKNLGTNRPSCGCYTRWYSLFEYSSRSDKFCIWFIQWGTCSRWWFWNERTSYSCFKASQKCCKRWYFNHFYGFTNKCFRFAWYRSASACSSRWRIKIWKFPSSIGNFEFKRRIVKTNSSKVDSGRNKS